MHHTINTRMFKADELQISAAPQQPRSQAMNTQQITARNQTAITRVLSIMVLAGLGLLGLLVRGRSKRR